MAWLSGYSYRRELTAVTTALGTTETNIPLAVFPPSLSGKCQADLDDCVFTGADGTTLLDWYWESKAASAPVGTVKVPSLTSGQSSVSLGYLYYGKADATDQSDEAGTFGSAVAARWALSEASGTVYDSTGNSNDGTVSGATYGVAGQVGSCLDFDGANDLIDCGAGASLDLALPLSLSCWCAPGTTTEQGYLIDHLNMTNYGYSLSWQLVANDKVLLRYGTGSAWADIDSSAVYSDSGAWVHVGVTIGADRAVAFYRNGAAAGTGTVSAYSAGSGTKLCIGCRDGARSAEAAAFDGSIDEVRVHSAQRSAAWMLAEYMAGAQTLFTFGSEESAAGGHPYYYHAVERAMRGAA